MPIGGASSFLELYHQRRGLWFTLATIYTTSKTETGFEPVNFNLSIFYYLFLLTWITALSTLIETGPDVWFS